MASSAIYALNIKYLIGFISLVSNEMVIVRTKFYTLPPLMRTLCSYGPIKYWCGKCLYCDSYGDDFLIYMPLRIPNGLCNSGIWTPDPPVTSPVFYQQSLSHKRQSSINMDTETFVVLLST